MVEETLKIDPQNLQLEREIHRHEKLKIFLMFVKEENIPPTKEQIGALYAYLPEDAIGLAMRDYPGKNIFWQGQSICVEDLIKQLYTNNGKIEITSNGPLPMPTPALTPKKLSKEQFKAGLQMAIAEFVDQKDRQSLKEIIERI